MIVLIYFDSLSLKTKYLINFMMLLLCGQQMGKIKKSKKITKLTTTGYIIS